MAGCFRTKDLKMKRIFGKKLGMTRIFDESGRQMPVTLIEAESLESFQEGEKVNITGISKGKGFAGTVKRHHFRTGPKTHGSDSYRRPGSIGSTFPQRVVKGRRMAGHLGAKRTTVQNLEVAKIDPPKKLILLRGAVPGPNKSKVMIWSPNEG